VQGGGDEVPIVKTASIRIDDGTSDNTVLYVIIGVVAVLVLVGVLVACNIIKKRKASRGDDGEATDVNTDKEKGDKNTSRLSFANLMSNVKKSEKKGLADSFINNADEEGLKPSTKVKMTKEEMQK
jgi:hypothetical protein